MPESAAATDAEPQALQDALRAVLAPLAQLAVAQGLPYAALEAMLKQAVVQAAAAVHAQAAPQRSVSPSASPPESTAAR